MPLIIRRAHLPADLEALLPPMLSTFYSPPSCVPYAEALWGPAAPPAKALARERLLHENEVDPTVLWILCIDPDARLADYPDARFVDTGSNSSSGEKDTAESNSKGMVVGAIQWKFYPTWVEKIGAPWEINVDYFEGEDKEEAETLQRILPGNVNKTIAQYGPDGKGGEPHVRMLSIAPHALLTCQHCDRF